MFKNNIETFFEIWDGYKQSYIFKGNEKELIKMGCPLIPENEVIKDMQIGEGSFGKVYKGHYKEHVIAIKKIKLVIIFIKERVEIQNVKLQIKYLGFHQIQKGIEVLQIKLLIIIKKVIIFLNLKNKSFIALILEII